MSAEKRSIDWDDLPGDVPPAEDRFLDKCTEVGNQIYDLMKERDMSQRDLARAVDKSESYVSRLLAGGVNATLRTVAEFEDALDATVLVAPMYAGRGEKANEQKPARVLKGATETQRVSFRAADYEQFEQAVEDTGREFDSCVSPGPNRASEHFERSLRGGRVGREEVEAIGDDDAVAEMATS